MIRFPKMHIATSVVNRLLNAAEGIDAPPPMQIPSTPEPNPTGAALDVSLAQTTEGAAPAASVIEGAATGKPALGSLIEG